MTKNKITCYLDSSVQLALVDDPKKNPQKQIMKNKTDDLWELFLKNKGQYTVIVSDTGLKEIKTVLTERHPKNELQDKIKEQQEKQNIIKHDIVNTNDDILFLAQEYINKGIFSEKQDKDALHVATATVKGFDYLLSWNFRQMANTNKLQQINEVNSNNGYNEILIMSPETYLIEYKETRTKILESDDQYKINSNNDHKINDEIIFECILYEPDTNNKNNKHKLKFKDHVILSGKTTNIEKRKPYKQNTYTIEIQHYTSISNGIKTTLPYTSLPQNIKDLLPETILITENRLDRYGVFRKPREIEQIIDFYQKTFNDAAANGDCRQDELIKKAVLALAFLELNTKLNPEIQKNIFEEIAKITGNTNDSVSKAYETAQSPQLFKELLLEIERTKPMSGP